MLTQLALLALIVGGFVSYLGLLPPAALALVDDATTALLCVFLLVVGYEIGRSRKIDLKGMGIASMTLPVATFLGSMAGGSISAFIMSTELKQTLAIAAGFGWYSLTGPMLTQLVSVEVGMVGLLANLFREMLTIVLYPVVAKRIGAVPAISMGGATTMDSTLPIIARYGGKDVALIAVFHGTIMSLLVPLAITALS